MIKRNHLPIYIKKWHPFLTLGLIIVPFLFLLIFSRILHVSIGALLFDLLISLMRLFAAYSIAILLGWIGAVLFYQGKSAAIALPLFDTLQSFPTFAILPLVTFFWGISNTTIIFFLVLTIVWPILFSIIGSLKLIKNEWKEAAQIMQLKGKVYFFRFLFPITVPGLITGSLIGLGEGWEALVATEIIIGAHAGLGSFFQSFSHNVPITAFGVFGFLILVFSINQLIWMPLLHKSYERMEE